MHAARAQRRLLCEVVSRAGLEPKRVGILYLPRNPDPGFTPGSTPGFGPDSESNSVAVSHNKITQPIDFTYLAS